MPVDPSAPTDAPLEPPIADESWPGNPEKNKRQDHRGAGNDATLKKSVLHAEI
jgi:hypothetical protein